LRDPPTNKQRGGCQWTRLISRKPQAQTLARGLDRPPIPNCWFRVARDNGMRLSEAFEIRTAEMKRAGGLPLSHRRGRKSHQSLSPYSAAGPRVADRLLPGQDRGATVQTRTAFRRGGIQSGLGLRFLRTAGIDDPRQGGALTTPSGAGRLRGRGARGCSVGILGHERGR